VIQFGEAVVAGVERRESCNGTTPIGDDDLFTGLHPIEVALDETRSIRPSTRKEGPQGPSLRIRY